MHENALQILTKTLLTWGGEKPRAGAPVPEGQLDVSAPFCPAQSPPGFGKRAWRSLLLPSRASDGRSSGTDETTGASSTRVREGEQRRLTGTGAPRPCGRCALGGRVLVVEDGHAHDAAPRRDQVGRLQLGRQLPLPLVAAVLNQILTCVSVRCRTARPALRAAQVALHVEGGPEPEDLAAREDRARLLLAARGLLLGSRRPSSSPRCPASPPPPPPPQSPRPRPALPRPPSCSLPPNRSPPG